MSKQGLKILFEQKLLLRFKPMNFSFCKHYVLSKQYKLKFNRSDARNKYILDLIHSNVCKSSDMSLEG